MNALNVFRSIALMLATTLLWTACKKSDKDKPKKPKCRIITMTSNEYTFNISYNSDNKIESISYGVSSFNYVLTFQYSGNTLIINWTLNGTPDFKVTVTQNQYGLATNVRREFIGTTGWDNTAFTYSGKEVIKRTTTSSSSSTAGITTYTWSDGNLISKKKGSTITTFDYYTGKPAQTGGYWDWSRKTLGYNFIVTKNLVKSSIQGGNIEQYSYNYDKDDKITSMTIKRGGNTTIWNYQYQCN